MRRLFIVLGFLSVLGCSEKKAVKKGLKEIAREVIIGSKNCALITVDSLGNAYARTMDPFSPEEDFTVWLATNPKSKKVAQIKSNPKVTLYYFDKDDPGYVTIQGTATLVNSEKEKQQFWKEEWQNFYKNRTTDYLLIKVIPYKLHVISEKHKILGDSITWSSPVVEFK